MILGSRSLRSLLVGLAAAGMCASCAGKPVEEGPKIRPVRWQAVFTEGSERVRTFSGVTKAGIESRLSFKVTGTVQAVAVQVGDRIPAGGLIARIDPRDYRLQVEEAEASLRRMQAQERNASASYERVRSLYEEGHASLNDLDAARASYETAREAVSSAEKSLELARSQLEYTTLTAPVEGSIASVPVQVNENVQPGQPVAVLTSGSRPEVEVAIPEALIGKIEPGSEVRVSLQAVAGPGLAARVKEVGVASTGLATTFPVTVRLEEANDAVRPGIAAEVAFRFSGGGGGDRILVPAVAVGEDAAGRFVFTVQRAGDGFVARRRAVTVGELTGGGLEITSGLADGDSLVTAGVHKLSDGRAVTLLGAAAGASAPAGGLP